MTDVGHVINGVIGHIYIYTSERGGWEGANDKAAMREHMQLYRLGDQCLYITSDEERNNESKPLDGAMETYSEIYIYVVLQFRRPLHSGYVSCLVSCIYI